MFMTDIVVIVPSEEVRQVVLWYTFNTFQICFTAPTAELLNKELSLLSFIFCRGGNYDVLKRSQQVLCFQCPLLIY